MTNQATLVLNGYMKISMQERTEVRNAIEQFERNDNSEKIRRRDSLNEQVKRIMGPTSSGYCSACGRG